MTPSSGLPRLVEHLSARAGVAGCWAISSDETARLLGVDAVRFWREVNALRHRISFGDAIDGFSQDTVGDLVTVLERLLGPGVEAALTRAGLFLPYKLGVQLADHLQYRARGFAAAHELRAEDLDGMVRHAGSVRAAIGIYLETHVDLDAILDSCAESFRTVQGLPPVARETAVRWLRRMFEKHVLDRRSLFTLLEERLRLAAAEMGHVDPEDRAQAGGQPGPGESRQSARQAWALRVMGFGGTGEALDADALRVRYRQLMMRHHPDVDPSGLERCKDVNVAYSLLIAGVAEA
ncbi:MAG: J domain-containing protein [Spirochaetes bacterium]|nr:J domain-containing protein [Spirochaetota bacterium]